MKLKETLHNINISKNKFFNLKDKSYLTIDLIKINLSFKSKMGRLGNKVFDYVVKDIEKSPSKIYYSGFNLYGLSKINFVNG